MAACTAIQGAGAGTLFAGDSRQLGRLVTKLSPRPRKLTSWFSLNEHQFLHHKCLGYNSRPRLSASAKQTGDGFLPDVSDETDELYDDLFKRYGKVVYRSTDQKPPSVEADEDAESLSFAMEMAKIASEVKAADLKLLFVKPLVYWTRYFIIATAFSNPQINAIGSKMRDIAEEKYGRTATGDVKPNSWTLLDFGDVVIHIFLPDQRTFYNLDEFYGNASSINLPFENQPPLQR